MDLCKENWCWLISHQVIVVWVSIVRVSLLQVVQHCFQFAWWDLQYEKAQLKYKNHFLDNHRLKMECYATNWWLWRKPRNFFIEPSFALGAPLSLFFVAIRSLFFTSTMVMHTCRHKAQPRAHNNVWALSFKQQKNGCGRSLFPQSTLIVRHS